MLIIHTTIRGQANTKVERGTWNFVKNHAKEFDDRNWNILHIELVPGEEHKFDYDGLFRQVWAKDDLTILERDMVPTWEQFVRLVTCRDLVCAVDYPLRVCNLVEVESGRARTLTVRGHFPHILVCCQHLAPHSMMRNLLKPNDDVLMKPESAIWNDGTWEYCDVPPLGLTKIRRPVMLAIEPRWPKSTWLDLDQMIGQTLAFNAVKTHIHYPMARSNHHQSQAHQVVSMLETKWPTIALNDVLPEYHWPIRRRYEETRCHWTIPRVVV